MTEARPHTPREAAFVLEKAAAMCRGFAEDLRKGHPVPDPNIPPVGYVSEAHLKAARDWGDAIDCLKWAAEMAATVPEMRAWRRAQRGEDFIPPDHMIQRTRIFYDGHEIPFDEPPTRRVRVSLFDGHHCRTEELVTGRVFADYDDNGRLMGIEVI